MISDNLSKNYNHKQYMTSALKEAEKAYSEGEVPVGCVIVHENKIIAKGHNRTESLQDPTAHAEMLAITSAADYFKSWRLLDCTLYSTIEPCTMCAGAIILARIKQVVFGAKDLKFGAFGSIYNVAEETRFNHSLTVIPGILEAECAAIMKDFFRNKRKEKLK
jgi:tRNA(adenine34) deaminase